MAAKRAITHKSRLRVRWLDRSATAACASGVYFTNYTSNGAFTNYTSNGALTNYTSNGAYTNYTSNGAFTNYTSNGASSSASDATEIRIIDAT